MSMPVSQAFMEKLIDSSGTKASFALPDGRAAAGSVDLLQRDAVGVLLVQGKLSSPEKGFFFFQRQTMPGKAGSMVGVVHFEASEVAFRVDPSGPGGSPMLVRHPVDKVICRGMERPRTEQQAGPETQNAPQTHPSTIGIPAYQNGVIPLQSLPGAKGVIYLDFDGDPGPFAGWSTPTVAAPTGATNAQIKEVWQMVAEDFQPFNLNVTTDRKVYDNAPQISRQRVMITPSFNGGGVAFIGSFNWTGDTVCWSGYSTGKNAAEVISHEVGHTLHLGHDGRAPAGGTREEYYGGGGTPYEVSWAPIMGVGYSANLTQWSKGEYDSPTNTEDDLLKITSDNNDVDYRVDDYGAVLANAGYLEIQPNNTVIGEGILETRTDLDGFRFETTGGTVSLTVAAVAKNPNLDILAEIVSETGTVIAGANPDAATNATVVATVGAGQYVLRVSGVGRGSPTAGGYTDYAVLGAYLVSGNVPGGVKPDRFSLAENSPNGTVAGTVGPRVAHGGNPITYSIASGNTEGVFTIDLATGAISVVNSAKLNFEAISTRWDDPATFELFVSIIDSIDPALNESRRVVVTATDVNEPPTLSAGGSITLLEHTRPGTEIRAFVGTDPDRFDFPTYSISDGNTGGAFVIDASTGRLAFAADTDASVQAAYTLTIRATDRGTPALSATAVVTISLINIPDGYLPGGVARAFYDNIPGGTVSNLTSNSRYPLSPDSEQLLPSFDGDGHGDNYGSVTRGFIIPPVTGLYRFWVASDDASELRFSTSSNPATATVVATITVYTDRYEWTRYPSQRSAEFTLQAGQPYYMEVRHKEGEGGDHVAVSWTGPGISQQVIPGRYLAPYIQNYAPKLTAAGLAIRQNALNGSTAGVLQVTDANVTDTHGSFAITGGTGAGIFGVDPATGRVFLVNGAVLNPATTPSYSLQFRVTDSGAPARIATASGTVSVIATSAITATQIEQQVWDGINGNNLSALTGITRYPNSPNRSRPLTSLDSGDDFAENYGSRIRAYLVPPTTGLYRLYLASDDEGQLRLATSASPTSPPLIASAPTATGRANWTTHASQSSAQISLVAGQRYYLEVLQKEGVGGDYVQVGWTGPGIGAITIVPDTALEPFDINTPPSWRGLPFQFSTVARAPVGTRVGTIAATDVAGERLTYAITGGNAAGAFALDPLTGEITVVNPSALPVGLTATLQVIAQDDGAGSRYPLRSVTASVAITVRTPASGSYEEGIVSQNPVAYWRLNETSTPTAFDYYRSYNGTHTGAVALGVAGPRPAPFPRFESGNTAMKLNGATTFVSIPPLNLQSNTVTITGWVKRTGNAPANSGLVFSRGGETVAGLHFGAANELRYTWNNAAFTWNSGLIPPDNQWTFVALVVEPSKATIYMNPGTGLVSATNTVAHALEEFDATLYLGQDPAGARFFNGSLDEVAIFNRALSPADIGRLDVLPSVTLTATGGTATEAGPTAGEFTFTRAGPNTAPLSVNVSISGTATRDIDYATSFTGLAVTIPAGASELKVAVTPVDDLLVDASESIVLSIAAGEYTLGTPSSGSVAITDNDNAPVVTITSPAELATVMLTNVSLTASATDDGSPQPLALLWTKVSGPGSVAFADAAAANTTVSFSTMGSYVLRLTASDGALQGADDVTLTVQGSPIEEWRKTKFGTNSSDPLISGDSQDPDRDGLVNLLEYALNLEPLLSGGDSVVFSLQTIGAERYLTLEIARNPDATDVTFSVEVSGDLALPAAWTATGTTIEANSRQLLRVRDNTPVDSANQRQIRLKVSRP